MNGAENNELQQYVSMDQRTVMPFQMSGFSPVVNSNSAGTVNFIVNICLQATLTLKTQLK